MNKEFYKTTIDLSIKNIKADKEKIEKAFASYMPTDVNTFSPYFNDLRGLILKQPDLLYGLSIYCSEGVNKNKDGFLRNTLISIFKTARNKFIDYEHDEEGENEKGQNPENYEIVGHIYDSQLAIQSTGDKIPDEDVYIGMDGNWFGESSPWRGKAIDVCVAWVIYQFQYPDLAQEIVRMSQENPDGFGVSMEILFNDYKFRIGGTLDPTESFDFDGNSLGITEVRKGDPLADQLHKLWIEGKGRTYKGLPVIRILGGDIFFSGMAITNTRANSRSYNISIGSLVEEYIKKQEDNKDLVSILKAVSSKNNGDFDISQCKIINGEPDCECIEKALASMLSDISFDLKELRNSSSIVNKK